MERVKRSSTQDTKQRKWRFLAFQLGALTRRRASEREKSQGTMRRSLVGGKAKKKDDKPPYIPPSALANSVPWDRLPRRMVMDPRVRLRLNEELRIGTGGGADGELAGGGAATVARIGGRGWEARHTKAYRCLGDPELDVGSRPITHGCLAGLQREWQ